MRWWRTGCAIIAYPWSIPILFGLIRSLDVHWSYDGDAMFWVWAAYMLPLGVAIEAAPSTPYRFEIGLGLYLVLLLVLTDLLWIKRPRSKV